MAHRQQMLLPALYCSILTPNTLPSTYKTDTQMLNHLLAHRHLTLLPLLHRRLLTPSTPHAMGLTRSKLRLQHLMVHRQQILLPLLHRRLLAPISSQPGELGICAQHGRFELCIPELDFNDALGLQNACSGCGICVHLHLQQESCSVSILGSGSRV